MSHNSPDPDRMVAAVHAYVAAFQAGSLDQIVALYAAEATVEDPVGTEAVRGLDAIRTFYAQAIESDAKLILDEPIRVTREHVAFPFIVVATVGGKEIRVEVIDIFRFNEANQIVEMRAYFGPTNMHGPA